MLSQDYGKYGLPDMTTETMLAARMTRLTKGLGRMTLEGTLPPPVAELKEKALWNTTDLEDWFGHLQPTQAAYASIDPDLGADELRKLGAYVCPARHHSFIGQRRPSMLVLYRSKIGRNAAGLYELEVYDVEWVQTQDGVMGETLALPAGATPAPRVPWSKVRGGKDGPYTLFKLDMSSKRILPIKNSPQRGGTLSVDSLQAALAHGSATAMKDGKVWI